MNRWPAIVLVCLLATGCGTTLVGKVFRPESYVVRRGDTLYSIAWRYGIDHRTLMRWNGISNPRNLQPGTRLSLWPGGGGADSGGTTSADGGARSGSTGGGTASGSPAGDADEPPEPASGGPEQWHWPTEGEVVGTFGDGAVAGRGIDISGRSGQAIHAAAGGEVVYSGAGLEAYGRLLIIRHSGDFLSAYAHNRELLVDEGEEVDAGQRIARMGESRDGTALLHFEIRRGGNPVDPSRYLPAR